MGNQVATNSVGQEGPFGSNSFTKNIRLRVGKRFLRLECGGQLHLTAHIEQAIPDDSFTFDIQEHTVESDDTDGRADILPAFKLIAVRCGKQNYLCAEKKYQERRCPIRVSFQPITARHDDGATWLVKRVPGDRYIMESYKFPGYCVAATDDGRSVGLQRMSKARRNKQLTFYPITMEQHIYRRHKLKSSGSSVGTSYSGESDLSVSMHSSTTSSVEHTDQTSDDGSNGAGGSVDLPSSCTALSCRMSFSSASSVD